MSVVHAINMNMGLASARPTKHKYAWAIILSLVMKCQPGNSVETKLAFPQVVQNGKGSIHWQTCWAHLRSLKARHIRFGTYVHIILLL